MTRSSPLLLAFVLTGCAAPPPTPTFVVSTPFNQKEAADLLRPGPNTIKGNAFMRQQGGGVVTCAGSEVHLVPATAYARQRMVAIYGTTESGTNSRPVNLAPPPSDYAAHTRPTRCDSAGNFVFDKVADGEFFVTTVVAWRVAGRQQGGNMMARTVVRDGQVASLVMAN